MTNEEPTSRHAPVPPLWQSFWKAYLVWMNRLIVTASNVHYAGAFSGLIPSGLLGEGIVFLYSMVLCVVLGRLVQRRGTAPVLGDESSRSADDVYRIAAEATLKETALAYLINTVLGLLLCAYLGGGFVSIGYGAIGLVMAMASPAGAGLMCCTNARTGRLVPALIVLGTACVVPGIVYVGLTLF